MVSFFPPHSQPSHPFGISELSILLDSIEAAAILLDGKRIAIVNARVTELTAYTRHELVGKEFEEFVTIGDKDADLVNNRSYTKPAPEVHLITRNNQIIRCLANPTAINEQWRLITFDPVDTTTTDLRQIKEHSEDLSALSELIHTLSISNIEEAIKKTLETGRKLLDSNTLAVYIGNSQKPSANRIACSGNSSIFPLEILSSDLNQLREPTHWIRGQRSIVTFLQQNARTMGFSFLATYPIRDVEALVGIVVTGGFQNPNKERCMQLLKILSSLLSTIINKNTLISNLWKNIQINENNNSVLESIKDVTSDGIATISPSLTINEINKAAEVILGYGNHEVKGLDVNEILIGSDRIVPGIQMALQGVTTPNLGEINLLRRDGSQFPAEVSTIPILNNKNILGAFVVLRDKSESEQIRVQTHQLEQRALLGEVTAVFAHEVRNPINNISTGLQLMAEEIDEKDSKQDIIKRMMTDCTRLTDLMESVLTFSSSGNYKLVPLVIGDLIEKLTNQWASRMNRLKINHHINIPETIEVEGDRRALEQVFTNLISNAIQAMEDMNGGTLAIKVTPHEYENGRSIVQIDISDTGPGIPKENMGRIFEPFFTTRKNGTGLGLAITKQIITAHRGSINLTSFPGGTVFHVKLPAINVMESRP